MAIDLCDIWDIYSPTFIQIKWFLYCNDDVVFMMYLLSYLHVFIEQHHQNEAEQDASNHHAG